MDTEIQALIANKTRISIPLPSGKKAIGCKWVYKTKFHVDGFIERNKARLVTQGFTQVIGIDFFHTFYPTSKLTTVRLIIALTSSLNLHLFQLYVHNAFLHGNLDE